MVQAKKILQFIKTLIKTLAFKILFAFLTIFKIIFRFYISSTAAQILISLLILINMLRIQLHQFNSFLLFWITSRLYQSFIFLLNCQCVHATYLQILNLIQCSNAFWLLLIFLNISIKLQWNLFFILGSPLHLIRVFLFNLWIVFICIKKILLLHKYIFSLLLLHL